MRVEVIKNKDFTVIDNCILRDETISLKARGLHETMMSLHPDWDFSIRGLAKILPDGSTSVRTALLELEKKKYLIRGGQKTGEGGRFGGGVYYVFDRPYDRIDPSELPDEVAKLLPPSDYQSSGDATTHRPPAAKREQYNTIQYKTIRSNMDQKSSSGRRAQEYTDVWNELTYEDYEEIASIYEDADRLISTVDEYVAQHHILIMKSIRNYILGVAERKNWPRKPTRDPLLM